MKATVYNKEGKKAGDVTLPEAVFGAAWNPDLVHQVVTSQQSNARALIAHTKGRGDVAGGGKKPWKQKGTGRARHGSIRSPIWRGGGITFGPTNEKNYEKKVNRKMKNRALFSVLSKKFADGEVLFLDQLSFDAPKTAEAKVILEALSSVAGFEALSHKKKNAVLVAVPKRDENIEKSMRNFGNVVVDEVRNLNSMEALTYKYLIIADPETSVESLEKRVMSGAKVAAEK